MSRTAPLRPGDDTGEPDLDRLVRRFEADWRAAPGRRPDLAAYLPDAPGARAEALTALARAELSLRWHARDRARVESYRDRFPALGGEHLAALVYEEFCLREEAGEAPRPAEYLARFPEVADLLGPVFEIHGLFGSTAGQTTVTQAAPPALPFPGVGDTIAGFRLVEELGRGAFARVFRAEERRLADRPVALKVARTGSREPQTLARLQHTHIVPIYSYRTDPATGLHLLCMPYLGRVTLARILADPALAAARTGSDLLAALDRLQPPGGARVERASARRTLAGRTFARSIAWWGARLAEALQHAHDRGVWHGDIKPSNVLVTDDGLPMLLDFNLAHEARLGGGVEPAALGGTIAYMAPEQLDALAQGRAEHAEGRTDLFALGVVLFEALAPGRHPFPPPAPGPALAEVLRRAADDRRAGAPRLRALRPETPAALAAVVDRCLAPRPEDRYATAADLAADLQAVADDGPLRHAREPLPSRSVRWLRRHRRRVAMLTLLAASAVALAQAQLDHVRREAEVISWINDGAHSAEGDRLERAVDQFATAARLAGGDPRLRPLRRRALDLGQRARRSKAARDQVDELLGLDDRLRFALLGFGSDPRSAARAVEAALGRFGVPRDPGWQARAGLDLLDAPRRARLRDEVNELLFLWVVALDRDRPGDPAMARQARAICDAALAFAAPPEPWRALRARYAGPTAGGPPAAPPPEAPGRETSARACFQWALLHTLQDQPEAAIAWLERATRLRPDDYWAEHYLGYRYDRAGQGQKALERYHAAVALRPGSPWAYYNRARLLRARGALDQARDDLAQALALARGFEFVEARLEQGVVRQLLGDAPGARSAFEAVIASGVNPYARAARLNRAKLEFDAGAAARARADYDALLADDPAFADARLGRALLALRQGQAAEAEADLTRLIRDDPSGDPAPYAHRALARLVLGRAAEAEADAARAWRARASPSHERLWVRALLALGRDRDRDLDRLTDPEDLDLLPLGGPPLVADLRGAVDRLAQRARAPGVEAALAHRTRAVLSSALRDPGAEAEATRAVALAPLSAEALRVRARVRRRAGDRPGALADVEQALRLEPDDPRSLTLRGLLVTELGRPADGLRDLDQALLRGASGAVRAARARALLALNRPEAALEEWSLALAHDPEDPRLFLGRARALRQARQWDRACADLEQAADWAGDRAGLLTRIAGSYAACLPARPDRLPRALALGRRAWRAWAARLTPPEVGR